MRRVRPVAAVAFLALLAGCSQPGPDGPDTPSSGLSSSVGDPSCAPAPAALKDAWAAPRWRAGDFWNWTVWRGGQAVGWENATVASAGPVGDVSACAHRLVVHRSPGLGRDDRHPAGSIDPGHDGHDAATMHLVWDERRRCDFVAPACRGDVPWPYDFPLRDGKAWAYERGGSAPAQVEAAVTLHGLGETLRLDVAHSESGSAGRGETFGYSPAVGNAVAWEQTDRGTVVERKVLGAYRHQAAEGAAT